MKPTFVSILAPTLFSITLLLASCAYRPSGTGFIGTGLFPSVSSGSELIKHPEWSQKNPSFPSYAGRIPIQTRSTPEDRQFKIATYNFNHVWGGNGYASRLRPKCSEGNYRAKLSLKGDGGRILAEVFFIDEDCFFPGGIHKNPDAATTPSRGYFFIYFPSRALAAVQQALAQPGTSKFLSFYDHEWAIESVGDIDADRPGK